MPTSERLDAVDILKATAIIAVVAIHAMFGPPADAPHQYLLELMRFAVPLFVAVSGWLYAEHGRVPAKRTGKRLRRVLLPYLVASVLAQLYVAWREGPRSLAHIGHDLLLASSLGPYYYVFVIVTLILLAPLIAKIPPRGVLATWATLLVLRGIGLAVVTMHEHLQGGDLFWAVRDPFYWGVYFLSGWLCALYRDQVAAVCTRHRRLLIVLGIGVAGALLAATMSSEAPLASSLASWVNTFVVSAVLVLVATAIGKAPAAVRFLSEVSYAIYLYHLFFVLEVKHALVQSYLSKLAAFSAGVAGACLVAIVSRRLLGTRARTWVGA